ncbi:MAG: hypothetical protein ABIY50_08110, partial [Ignavibacteria bacterium]
MNFINRISQYFKNRDTLKYKFHKFINKNSESNENSPLVIIWELGGFGDILKKNAIISAALKLRGYRTHAIICDGSPVACIQRGFEKNEKPEDWSKKCPGCLYTMKYTASQYNVEYTLSKDYITTEQMMKFDEISKVIELNDLYVYNFLGVNVGMLAWSTFVRYMKGYVIEKKDVTNENEIILRKYFYAGLVNTHIAGEVLDKLKPVSVFSSHGVYVDYAPIILLAFLRGIRALCWSSGYKILLHYFTVPKQPNKLEIRGITENEWKKRESKSLTEKENKILDKYIFERFNKGNKEDFLNLSLPESKEVLKTKLGIKNNNKIVCIFCHLGWDLSFDLSTMLFANANEWLDETIKVIIEMKEVNWIIRVHPGERVSGSLYTVDDYIKENFKDFPEHIKILWSDSEINSFGLYQLIDAGITLFGTAGAELPLLGKSIISGGEAYFSNKGFSLDAKSKEEYYEYLRSTPDLKPLSKEQIETARKYAYSFFIQRQIPINVINKSEGHFGNIDMEKIDQLLPGKDLIMDLICESIIEGKDVV